MLTTNYRQYTWSREGDSPWRGIGEASDLGLRPGEWPAAVLVKGKHATRLFTDTTIPHPVNMAQANEVGHRYADSYGNTVFIVND